MNRRQIRTFGTAATAAAGALALATMFATVPAGASPLTSPVNGATVTLTSVATGECLSGRFADTASLTPAVQAACQGLRSQQWVLGAVTGTSPQRYTLRNADSGKCLNVAGGDSVPGSPLIEYSCAEASANSQFTLAQVSGSTYRLIVASSSMCIDVPGGVSTPNLQLTQYGCHNGANQQWTIDRDEPLQFANPGFESGTANWAFSAHSGIATNPPRSGTKLVYLDQGSGYTVSQTVTAVSGGTYDFSVWATAGAAGGTLSVTVGSTQAGSAAILAGSVYRMTTVSRVTAPAGSAVTVTLKSSPTGWVNADDFHISPSALADPIVTSGNPTVVSMFNWAKAKANAWVQEPGSTGLIDQDEGNTGGRSTGIMGTTYWAGYPYRSLFYSRDFAHAVPGAFVLGLDAENKTMLRSFATSAQSHSDYPVWSFNLDGNTYGAIDYYGQDSYYRELPAPFELAQRVGDGYDWTGDVDYLTDPKLIGYVNTTVGSFVDTRTGPINNGTVKIAQATSGDPTVGVASYAEGQGYTYAESADALGSQYQAYLAAASLATAAGNNGAASAYTADASALYSYYNSTWSVDPGNSSAVVRAFSTTGVQQTGWGYETTWFAPLKQVMAPGQRLNNYLNYIDTQASSGSTVPANVKALTYLPDAYFANHSPDKGGDWMNKIYASVSTNHSTGRLVNGDYPEVSFTLVGQTVEGLLGLHPSGGTKLTTYAEVPSNVGWLQVAGIPVGEGTITLKQTGQNESKLSNTSTGTIYHWEARFPGQHTISKNGASVASTTVHVDGNTYTQVAINVTPGQTIDLVVTG